MADNNHTTNFDDELLSAYVDGELTGEERAVVEARLESDPAARELVAELRGLSSTLRSLPRERSDEDVRSLVMAQIGVSKVSLPSCEPGRNNLRILLWPAVMIAAALMLMFTQGNEEPRDRELAQVEPTKVEADRAAGERLAADKVEESAREEGAAAPRGNLEISAAEPPAGDMVADNAPAGGAGGMAAADGASELREEAATRDHELAQPEFTLAPDPELSNQLRSALANTEAELGIVHLTLTDLPAGVEKFDRLLISNGVQVDSLSEGNESMMAAAPATESAASEFDATSRAATSGDVSSATTLSGRAGGLGGGLPLEGSARFKKAEAATEPEMILVEAPAEQIANILMSCSQDTQAIKEVKIDPTANGFNTKREKQRLSDYQQYERGAAAKAESKTYDVSPAQQGMIEALNSIDAPAENAEPVATEGQPNQGWAAKLRNDQPPADLKQLNTDYNSRRNSYFFNARQQQAAVPPDQKLAKDKVSGEQWMRVLFLLHPDEDQAKKN
jgi:hypothetical protein